MTKRRGRGEGSIFRRADGRWVGSITLPPDGGKRRRKVVYGKTFEEARRELRKVQIAVDSGLPTDGGRLTLDQFLGQWIATTVPGSVADSTVDDYHDVIRLHLVPGLGHRRLSLLTVNDCDVLWATKREAGYKPNTIRIMRAVLQKALSQAEKEGLVPRNVARLSQAPRIRQSEARCLTIDQARQLIGAARGDRLEACYLLMLTFGLRRGEALGLAWADFNASNASLAVRQSVKRVRERPNSDGTYPSNRKTQVILSELKTVRSRRTLFLTPPLVEALRTHRSRQAEERMALGSGWHDLGLIFPSRVGTIHDPDNFSHEFNHFCIRAGIGRWNPHALRHSGASLMLAQGTPLHVVSEVLGHSSIAMTKDVYGHLVEGQKREAAEAISAALFG